jgi:hypothetical protein
MPGDWYESRQIYLTPWSFHHWQESVFDEGHWEEVEAQDLLPWPGLPVRLWAATDDGLRLFISYYVLAPTIDIAASVRLAMSPPFSLSSLAVYLPLLVAFSSPVVPEGTRHFPTRLTPQKALAAAEPSLERLLRAQEEEQEP